MSNSLWDKPLKVLFFDFKNKAYVVFRTIFLLLYWLIFATIPIFLLYKWNFQHASEINKFFQYAIWPLVVILIAFCFEKEIKEMLRNIKKAKTPIGDFEFDKPKEQIDKSKTDKEKIEELEKKLESSGTIYLEEIKKIKDENFFYFIRYHFERAYRLIFGSQLAILSTILNNQDNKISEQLAQLFHRNSSFYPNYPFDQYINFLINMKLIVFNKEDRSFSLTPIGSMFLGYLKTENINPNKLPY